MPPLSWVCSFQLLSQAKLTKQQSKKSQHNESAQNSSTVSNSSLQYLFQGNVGSRLPCKLLSYGTQYIQQDWWQNLLGCQWNDFPPGLLRPDVSSWCWDTNLRSYCSSAALSDFSVSLPHYMNTVYIYTYIYVYVHCLYNDGLEPDSIQRPPTSSQSPFCSLLMYNTE